MDTCNDCIHVAVCGDCFHAELCEKSEMLIGFSRDNPAYCSMFLNSANVAPMRHGRWVDNHCTACGMMPMGDEMWKNHGFEPPLFERFMDYCPSCGAKMDEGAGNGC